MKTKAPRNKGTTSAGSLREGVLAADPAVLGRALSLAERDPSRLEALLGDLGPPPAGAFRVGVTGPPGAGKSSILREVIRRLLDGGQRAALVACDPSSTVTGGAFLGDRLRLAGLSADPRLFVRSFAHRGASGEPLPAAVRAMDLLEVAGFGWIFLETLGTGQAEDGALRGSHVKVLVHSPDGGDEFQMLKAGVIETADIHVVMKSDRPGAAAWAASLRESLGPPRPEGGPTVFAASALTGEGVDALVEELERRRSLLGGKKDAGAKGPERRAS